MMLMMIYIRMVKLKLVFFCWVKVVVWVKKLGFMVDMVIKKVFLIVVL